MANRISLPPHTIICPVHTSATPERRQDVLQEIFRTEGNRRCHAAPVLVGVDKEGRVLIAKSRLDEIPAGTTYPHTNFSVETEDGVIDVDNPWTDVCLPQNTQMFVTSTPLKGADVNEILEELKTSRNPALFDRPFLVATGYDNSALILRNDGVAGYLPAGTYVANANWVMSKKQ